MPAVAGPNHVDWDLAFLLFSKGATYPDISLQTGATLPAIRKRASRHQWRDKVAVARHTVSQDVQNRVESRIKGHENTIMSRGQAWVDKAATDVERTVEVLGKLKVPKSIKGLQQYEDVWGSHVKRGRATFGLDQAGAAVQVNVGVRIGDLEIESAAPTLDSQSSVDP